MTLPAIRLSDGTEVVLKKVGRGLLTGPTVESEILLGLSACSQRINHRNHSIPILDYFYDEGFEGFEILVLLSLRRYDNPPLETVWDALYFIQQTLEVRNRFISSQTTSINPIGSRAPSFQQYRTQVSNRNAEEMSS